jgi:hypothetical protein|tara:strand:- start:85 stop:516 length:432 start_codon:yes stop_codon:yes gene_type:complete
MNKVLEIHSFWALLTLGITLITILKFFYSFVLKKEFKNIDFRIALIALIFNHIQLLIGVVLYYISPKFDWWNEGVASVMSNVVYRQYLVEHPIANIIGVLILTVGWSIHKKATIDSKKFLRIGGFYLIGLLAILSRIPWNNWL